MSSDALSTGTHARLSLYGAVFVPDLAVQSVLRHMPALGRQPLAVLDGIFPLQTVVATNPCARRLGVRTGMTRLQLERFTGVQIRHRSRAQEESAYHALLDTMRHFSPRVEDTAVDLVTLDLSGLSGLWGTPRSIAQKLFRAASREGLEVHVAAAPNPDTAIHAARAGAGITIIGPGDEAGKLARFPVSLLDLSEVMAETFHRWGIQTFGDLAKLPAVAISERLGPEGVRLRSLARGAVERPLRPAAEPPRFAESMEPESPVGSLEPLLFILNRLLKPLCRRLTARNLATNRLQVTFETGGSGIERCLRLPVPMRDARTLLKLLEADLDARRLSAPVSKVTIVAEPVAPQTIQEHLFDPGAPEPGKLQLTLARIGNIVGRGNVGTPALVDSHRPDAFRIHPFRVVPTTTPSDNNTRSRASAMSSPVPAALRISRPAQPVTVETERGQPSRLLFAGKTGKVVTCAGPWNASGDWWRGDTWSREEWDVEVQTDWRRTLYRIYRDPRKNCWFIDGTYD